MLETNCHPGPAPDPQGHKPLAVGLVPRHSSRIARGDVGIALHRRRRIEIFPRPRTFDSACARGNDAPACNLLHAEGIRWPCTTHKLCLRRDEDIGGILALVVALADQVVELSAYRTRLADYLRSRMQALAPNLTTLVGELVGAHLVQHAGGGAERAPGGGRG